MKDRDKMKKKPDWLKVNYDIESVMEINELMNKLGLKTVCNEAGCPNLGECYKNQTATFMILGNICTRNCRFCKVETGHVEPIDPAEPSHLAEAVKTLGLKHVVITSVTRDDLPDGGAGHFARTIRTVKLLNPEVTIEVLIPDFQGNHASLDLVVEAEPDVINHNIETVRKFYSEVRPEADYDRSIALLSYVKQKAPSILTKTGMMVGLGETEADVLEVMDDCRKSGCDIFTIGQYLRPSEKHIEVKDYVSLETFSRFKKLGEEMGFSYIASEPLVRSSYQAEKALRER